MKNTTGIKKLLKMAIAGLFISFLGSLPLGTMNIAVTYISIQQGAKAGLIYATGSMLVEVIVVRMSLGGLDRLIKWPKLFSLLEFFTVGMMLALAAGSFILAFKTKGYAMALPAYNLNPFLSGVLLSATNPLHVPFWLGWSTVLMNKEILMPGRIQYNWYVTGIGAGTILGFMVFIYGGNYLVSKIMEHQNILNWIIGMVLLFTAIIQIRKMRAVPVSIRYGKMISSSSIQKT